VRRPAAQVGVLPVQKEALVETTHGSKRFAPRQQAGAREPIDDDAFLATHAANGFVHDDVAPGDGQERNDVSEEAGSPNSPVSMSGSAPRALPCTEPSGSRMRGPAMAHCG